MEVEGFSSLDAGFSQIEPSVELSPEIVPVEEPAQEPHTTMNEPPEEEAEEQQTVEESEQLNSAGFGVGNMLKLLKENWVVLVAVLAMLVAYVLKQRMDF